ncbi:hypothetical protein BU24DRAFT_427717 [Aaosphaeria arxii CBS 175.79]|uniref:Uncharacterized protein n=1 Tax=Aaosphaeria arxii CBS 175.79 TaxID=1450172 RepID=A0A6A5XCV6_9PLEO|nr:uncharacterized protein BU24DRAFT_427717 [Aaosphaeria arxii CBS 175.79]KAF2010604.1 hypothetical protein BU24DRAFT_427717 [Aaosphaeria arxii CBS 175.79]
MTRPPFDEHWASMYVCERIDSHVHLKCRLRVQTDGLTQLYPSAHSNCENCDDEVTTYE